MNTGEKGSILNQGCFDLIKKICSENPHFVAKANATLHDDASANCTIQSEGSSISMPCTSESTVLTKDRKNRKRRGTNSPKKLADVTEEGGRPSKIQPTHFLCVRLTDAELHGNLWKIQKEFLLRSRGKLEKLLTEPVSFHLTLGVYHLTEATLPVCRKALNECMVTLPSEFAAGFSVRFKGVGRFRSNVVFAKVDDGLDELKKLREFVVATLKENRLEPTDKRPFSPHLTLMKSSRESSRGGKFLSIPRDVTSDLDEIYFGRDTCDRIQLCQMGRNSGEFYGVDHEVKFTAPGPVVSSNEQAVEANISSEVCDNISGVSE